MHIPNQVSNTLRQIPTVDLIDIFCNEIHRRQRFLSQDRCSGCGELLARHERTACFLDGQKLTPEDFHVDVVVTVAIKPGEWDSLFHRVGRQMTSLGRMNQGERSISREPLSDCPDCIVAYYRGYRIPYCNAHLPEQYKKQPDASEQDFHYANEASMQAEGLPIAYTPRATASDFEAANTTSSEMKKEGI